MADSVETVVRSRACVRIRLGGGKGGGRLRPVRDAFGGCASPVRWYLER